MRNGCNGVFYSYLGFYHPSWLGERRCRDTGQIFAMVRLCFKMYHSSVSNALFSLNTSTHTVEYTFNNRNEWGFNRPSHTVWRTLTNQVDTQLPLATKMYTTAFSSGYFKQGILLLNNTILSKENKELIQFPPECYTSLWIDEVHFIGVHDLFHSF